MRMLRYRLSPPGGAYFFSQANTSRCQKALLAGFSRDVYVELQLGGTTQYALFGTLWSLPAKALAGFSGRIVDAIGYRSFFVYTALIGLPALLLIIRLMRTPPPEPASSAS